MKAIMALAAALTMWAGALMAEEAEPTQPPDWMPDRVFVLAGSRHIGIDPTNFGRTRWNEVNPGLVFSWRKRFLGLDYQLGGFVNSFDEWATHVSVAKTFPLRDDLELALIFSLADYGVNSRYFPVKVGGSDFVVIPAWQLNYRNLFLQVIPSSQTNAPLASVVAAGVSFPLKRD